MENMKFKISTEGSNRTSALTKDEIQEQLNAIMFEGKYTHRGDNVYAYCGPGYDLDVVSQVIPQIMAAPFFGNITEWIYENDKGLQFDLLAAAHEHNEDADITVIHFKKCLLYSWDACTVGEIARMFESKGTTKRQMSFNSGDGNKTKNGFRKDREMKKKSVNEVNVVEIEKVLGTDKSCLADGYVFEVDPKKTGINKNELIVGSTGCGKSFSVTYPRILHTFESSLIVPIAKKAVKEMMKPVLEKRGYKIVDLDFADGSFGKIGYDPMDYIYSDMDIVGLAEAIVGDPSQNETNADFWNDSAIALLEAEIEMALLEAEERGTRASVSDIVDFHNSIEVTGDNETNRDNYVRNLWRRYPNGEFYKRWRTFSMNPDKTLRCVLTTLSSRLGRLFIEETLEISNRSERIDFSTLGDEKTAVFITTSPVNKGCNQFVNLMYSDIFKALFEKAERSGKQTLSVPVHVICDDFACGARIRGFEDYISIFRAAGISVTLLLQSESQLSSMYGDHSATTIINNCDTYLYMGGQDLETCNNVATRLNKPLNKVLEMELEQVLLFRRGSKPVTARRYQIMEDPLYIQAIAEMDRR